MYNIYTVDNSWRYMYKPENKNGCPCKYFDSDSGLLFLNNGHMSIVPVENCKAVNLKSYFANK